MEVSEVISFLYTKNTLKSDQSAKSDPDFKNFDKQFGIIQNDLGFHPKLPPIPIPNPVPAEDLQNLSPTQSAQIIENTKWMESTIGKVEKTTTTPI